jgi:Flp pilus assembly protein TadD
MNTLLRALPAWLGVATLLMLGAGCNQSDSSGPTGPSSTQQRDTEEEFEKGANRPPSPRTMFTLARLYLSQGRDAEASVVLARLIQDHPKFLPAYYELAELQVRYQKTAEAMKVISAGLKVSPRDPILLNNMGMCHLLKQDYAAALVQFRRAAVAAPGDARYRANMALALGMMGRYEESLALYGQILPPAEAHYNLAVICEGRKDNQRASSEYAQAFSLDPSLRSRAKPPTPANLPAR